MLGKHKRVEDILEDRKLFASYGGMREIASQIAGTDHTEACYFSDRLPRGKDPQETINLFGLYLLISFSASHWISTTKGMILDLVYLLRPRMAISCLFNYNYCKSFP